MERPLGFPSATMVADQLMCGALFDLYDLDLLNRFHVTHALIIGKLPGEWDEVRNCYRTLPLPINIRGTHELSLQDVEGYARTDSVATGEQLTVEILKACCDFIGAALLDETRSFPADSSRGVGSNTVLVCCGDQYGCSSSNFGPIIAVSYLAARAGHHFGGAKSWQLGNVEDELESSLRIVRNARPIAFSGNPSDALLSVLLDFDRDIKGLRSPTLTVSRIRDIMNGDEADSEGGLNTGNLPEESANNLLTQIKTSRVSLPFSCLPSCFDTSRSSRHASVGNSIEHGDVTGALFRIDELESFLPLSGNVSDEIIRHKNKIAEDLLTLHCPECGMAFIDFSNCFALWCALCNCAFCAYCQQSCRRERNDAHSHVAQCEYNVAPGKSIFASRKLFEHSQNLRRVRKLSEYLAQLSRPLSSGLSSPSSRSPNDRSKGESNLVATRSEIRELNGQANETGDEKPLDPSRCPAQNATVLESGQESSPLESARLRLEVAHAIRKDLADLGIIMTFDASSGDVHLSTTTSIPKNEGVLAFGGYMPRHRRY